jgi:hypothetical protein
MPLDGSSSAQGKECGPVGCHSWYKQIAIEEQISHLATGLRDQQAAMAGRSVCRTIAAPIVWLVIGAHRIVRADSRSIESVTQDADKSRRCSDETTQRALRSGGCRVNQDPASVGSSPGRAGQDIDALLQRARRIATVECDFRHERMRQAVQEHIGCSRIIGWISGEPLDPMQIPAHQPVVARLRGRFETDCQACSSLSRTLASLRSSVSKPSVNQP